MILALQLACAFMFGVGFIFALIEFRSRFGHLFRNFAACLLAFPTIALLDLFSYADYTPPSTKLILQRLMHLLVLPYIPFSTAHLLRLAGRKPGRFPALFAAAALLMAPTCCSDAFLVLRDGQVRGGPWYVWTFLPFGTVYIIYAYGVMIGHLRSVPPAHRKFPALHLIGFILASAGGFMDMLGVVDSRWFVFCSCKSIGILVFGIFCAYFFADQFFTVLRERSDLFRRLEELNAEFAASEPIRAMGESAAFISREIKNHMSVLRNNQLLLRRRFAEADAPEEIDRIGRSTERLETFARGLLDYSNGSKPTRRDRVELIPALEECVARRFAQDMHKIGISAEGDSAVFGEPSCIETVFGNLIRNSLEAGAGRVSICLEARDARLNVTVSDDGPGYSPEVAANIGRPFFTTKKAAGGTGLGTAVAVSIMHGLGGSIRFLSGAGMDGTMRGLTVELEFPRALESPLAPPFQSPALHARSLDKNE